MLQKRTHNKFLLSFIAVADFSRVVYRSRRSETLFTYDSIISMCTLETLQLKNVPQYSELCESKVNTKSNFLVKTMMMGFFAPVRRQRDKMISFFWFLTVYIFVGSEASMRCIKIKSNKYIIFFFYIVSLCLVSMSILGKTECCLRSEDQKRSYIVLSLIRFHVSESCYIFYNPKVQIVLKPSTK